MRSATDPAGTVPAATEVAAGGLPGRLVPAGVVARASRTDLSGPDQAVEAARYPEEAAVVARAVAGRQREFHTTRALARAALAGLGLAAAPIPRGRQGSPSWPAGVTGSLTHCHGLRAAAVTWTSRFRGLGLDAEVCEPLPGDVVGLVSTAAERRLLADLRRLDGSVPWDRLLFSAKESVYKAWYPITGRWLDFADVTVELSPRGTFRALLQVPAPVLSTARLGALDGRWGTDGCHLATVVLIPA